MRLYIAGPISADPSRTVEEKIQTFYTAADLLRQFDFDPFPATDVVPDCGLTPEECSATQVHVAGQGQGKHSWECYMKYDLREMLLCDGVALLRGWLMSPGARIEVNTAIAVHLPVKSVSEWISEKE